MDEPAQRKGRSRFKQKGRKKAGMAPKVLTVMPAVTIAANIDQALVSALAPGHRVSQASPHRPLPTAA